MSKLFSTFRDPTNGAFSWDEKWYRVATRDSALALKALRNSDIYPELVSNRWLLPFEEVSRQEAEGLLVKAGEASPRTIPPGAEVFRVESLEIITFPWEWTNRMLSEAAELTLNLRDKFLEIGLDLKDASAFNVQFVGSEPVFMDLGSVCFWEPRVSWPALRQFVEHFVNPLAVGSSTRLSSGEAWRIGARDGLRSRLARAIMPLRLRLRSRLALLQFAAVPGLGPDNKAEPRRRISEADTKLCVQGNRSLNQRLRRQLSTLGQSVQKSTWQSYGPRSHYQRAEVQKKISLVHDFVSRNSNGTRSLVLDLGGNDGAVAFSLAEQDGHTVVIADSDAGALENLSESLRGSPAKSKILPLLADLTNLDIFRGVLGSEFEAFDERIKPTVVCCHAVLHHVVITQGTPMKLAVASVAQFGVPLQIEFVHEEDAMVQLLKSQIADWQGDYSLDSLLDALGMFYEKVAIVDTTTPSRSVVEAEGPRRIWSS